MIVVADTSPLNYLILLGQVRILESLYGSVTIPNAVRDEMLADGAPSAVREWAQNLPDWVEVVSVLRVDETLPQRLGEGERQAISLALDLHADIVLIDDLPARLAAEERGLLATGCLTALLEAANLGLLDFKQALRNLKAFRFRISPELETTFLRLAQKNSRSLGHRGSLD